MFRNNHNPNKETDLWTVIRAYNICVRGSQWPVDIDVCWTCYYLINSICVTECNNNSPDQNSDTLSMVSRSLFQYYQAHKKCKYTVSEII